MYPFLDRKSIDISIECKHRYWHSFVLVFTFIFDEDSLQIRLPQHNLWNFVRTNTVNRISWIHQVDRLILICTWISCTSCNITIISAISMEIETCCFIYYTTKAAINGTTKAARRPRRRVRTRHDKDILPFRDFFWSSGLLEYWIRSNFRGLAVLSGLGCR